MGHQQNSGDPAWEMAKSFFVLFLSVVFGLFLISQLLTRMLFRHVLNPLLDGLLDREDGMVVLLAAALWSLVAGLLLFPLALSQDAFGPAAQDLLGLWLGTTLGGALWGTAVGVWILGAWWQEAEEQMPVGYDVVQLLDVPLDIRQPATRRSHGPDGTTVTMPEDAELERLILGNGPWS